jgi:threonine aldolase
MSEVGGSIQWIDNPQIGGEGLFDSAAFLSQKSMGGKTISNMVDHALFCGTICVCHQVDRVLVFDAKTACAIVEKKRSGFSTGRDSGF